MTHPGIELRVTLATGEPVLQANSDMLNLMCGLRGWDNAERWSEVLGLHNGIQIQARAVELPDLDVDQAAEPADQADEVASVGELLDQLNKIPCWQCRLCKWTYQPGGSHFCPIAQRHLKEEDIAEPSNGAERMKTVVLEELNEIFRDKLHANDFRAVHALLYDYAQQRH